MHEHYKSFLDWITLHMLQVYLKTFYDHTGKKDFVKLSELKKKISKELESMQKDLLDNAKKQRDDMIVGVKEFHELTKAIKDKKIAKTMWCNALECEDLIKDKTNGAKIVTIPFDEKPKGKCVHCTKPAKHEVYVAKSY